jgi:hypothetical protein
MNRSIPISNKLLSRKWADKDKEIHHKKLKEAKSSIDLRSPTSFRHLVKKAKKG